MSMKHYIISAILILAAAQLSAQSLSYLNVSNDARTLSMGGASVAVSPNAYALENNAAAMAMYDGTLDIAASFGNWQPQYSDIKMPSLGAYFKIGNKLAVGVSGRYLMEKPYTMVSSVGATLGTYTPVDFYVGVGVAYKVVDFLSIGINAKYISSQLAEDVSGKSFAGDISLMFKKNGFGAGLSVNNLGQKVKYGSSSYSLPTMAKLGFAYESSLSEAFALTATAEAGYLFAGGFSAGVGVDLKFVNIVSVRAGYHYGDAQKAVPSYASAGLGIDIIGINLSGSYLLGGKDSPLKNSFCATLGYRF